MTREEKAVYYKHNGFNCCQSVIKAMIDYQILIKKY